METLRDLNQLAKDVVARFNENFNAKDCRIPQAFKSNVQRLKSFSIVYNEYSVIIKGDGVRSKDSYVPNQSFYMASFFIEYALELSKYKQKILPIIIDSGISTGDLTNFFTYERDYGKGDIANGNDKFVNILDKEGYNGPDRDYLIRFVTDYSWWSGSKTIDRSDFFNSPVLNIMGLTASSNAAMALIVDYLTQNPSDNALLLQHIEKENYDNNNMEKNLIYYGAPGTGKSHRIDETLKKVPDAQVKRVTFYPDYTYTDFIGGLLPVTDKEEKPKYKFVEGPFTEILKDAFDNPDKSYYIVIEEINRGNPAAIFGDVFQLLDRDSSGKSRYTITNKDICSYLRDEDNTKFENDRFWIPSNLNIVCTMNTADQNVFVLDTAFKRRFKMEYVPIDFKKLQDPRLEEYNAETNVFAGNKSIKEIFESADLSSYISEHESELKRNWPTFAQLVNEKINIINRNGDSISEDKKLGPFFVSLDELADRRKFVDKVLYYLKQDVFKYTDSVLTPSYQKLYDDFVNGNADIFELFATAK